MAAPPSDRSSVGAVGLTAELFEFCAALLEEIATLERLPDGPSQTWHPDSFAALLIVLRPPLADSVATFGAIRRQHPLLPLLVLAEGVDANFAVELLKCGADDFLLLPPAPEALQHKVRRVLGQALGPAFETPEFAVFKPREGAANERHCFRVSVPPDYAVASIFPGPVDRALEVKDLSIETEKAPGGMQIAADRATARRLPFDQWNRRKEIELSVRLPAGSPISTRARLIPGLRNAPDGSIRFAVEYWVTRPAEKERFRRYWVEAQRRMRRVRK
jgi:hypothetical protein